MLLLGEPGLLTRSAQRQLRGAARRGCRQVRRRARRCAGGASARRTGRPRGAAAGEGAEVRPSPAGRDHGPVAVLVPQVVVIVAVNWAVPPGDSVVVLGETLTPRILSVTVTGTVVLDVGEAWLVATTW